MIGKLTHGSNAGGLLRYLLGPRDQAGRPRARRDVLGGSLTGRDAKTLAAEIEAIRRTRPGVRQHVMQTSLRISDEDPGLSDAQWTDVARDWAQSMGLQAYVVVAHSDHEIHVAATRIHLDGSIARDWQAMTRSEAAIRQIEQRHGLRQVAPSHLLDKSKRVSHRRSPSRADLARAERGDVSPGYVVREALDEVLVGGCTLTDLVARLAERRIDVVANVAASGRVAGLSYKIDEHIVTAKAMGRGYTWANLLTKGLSYDTDRDREATRSKRPIRTDPALSITSNGLSEAGSNVPCDTTSNGPGNTNASAGGDDNRDGSEGAERGSAGSGSAHGSRASRPGAAPDQDARPTVRDGARNGGNSEVADDVSNLCGCDSRTDTGGAGAWWSQPSYASIRLLTDLGHHLEEIENLTEATERAVAQTPRPGLWRGLQALLRPWMWHRPSTPPQATQPLTTRRLSWSLARRPQPTPVEPSTRPTPAPTRPVPTRPRGPAP